MNLSYIRLKSGEMYNKLMCKKLWNYKIRPLIEPKNMITNVMQLWSLFSNLFKNLIGVLPKKFIMISLFVILENLRKRYPNKKLSSREKKFCINSYFPKRKFCKKLEQENLS